jgi:diguanylate cyclase (GGDEF)-like protein
LEIGRTAEAGVALRGGPVAETPLSAMRAVSGSVFRLQSILLGPNLPNWIPSWKEVQSRLGPLQARLGQIFMQAPQVSLLLVALVGLGAALFMWAFVRIKLANQKRRLEDEFRRRIDEVEGTSASLLRTCEQLRQYAERDYLTGLWNRRVILDILRGEVDRSRRDGTPLSLILVDLDHFKLVNDTFGHASGDRVLKEISALFVRSVRRYDWVGRYGGEEFLIILPGASFVNARARAEQIRLAVQTSHMQDGEKAMKITASFGVASGFPTDAEALVDASDTALYRAKNNGRNCVMVIEIEPAKISPLPQQPKTT